MAKGFKGVAVSFVELALEFLGESRISSVYPPNRNKIAMVIVAAIKTETLLHECIYISSSSQTNHVLHLHLQYIQSLHTQEV